MIHQIFSPGCFLCCVALNFSLRHTRLPTWHHHCDNPQGLQTQHIRNWPSYCSPLHFAPSSSSWVIWFSAKPLLIHPVIQEINLSFPLQPNIQSATISCRFSLLKILRTHFHCFHPAPSCRHCEPPDQLPYTESALIQSIQYTTDWVLQHESLTQHFPLLRAETFNDCLVLTGQIHILDYLWWKTIDYLWSEYW